MLSVLLSYYGIREGEVTDSVMGDRSESMNWGQKGGGEEERERREENEKREVQDWRFSHFETLNSAPWIQSTPLPIQKALSRTKGLSPKALI
jgi:hypothetical protein